MYVVNADIIVIFNAFLFIDMWGYVYLTVELTVFHIIPSSSLHLIIFLIVVLGWIHSA